MLISCCNCCSFGVKAYEPVVGSGNMGFRKNLRFQRKHIFIVKVAGSTWLGLLEWEKLPIFAEKGDLRLRNRKLMLDAPVEHQAAGHRIFGKSHYWKKTTQLISNLYTLQNNRGWNLKTGHPPREEEILLL